MITNAQSGTRIDEIAPDLFRISTPVAVIPGGFTFNQYLLRDEAPLLFHTGPRRMFPLVREAIAAVLPVESLAFIASSHFEADECGALNELLAVAPRAVALGSKVAVMISLADIADRAPRALADGERLSLGRHVVRWQDTPHLPHGWDCGYLFDETSGALLCGDIFTQGGADHPPSTEAEILGPSEAMRGAMDYYAHAPNSGALLEKLAALRPTTLACMHGAAFRGDGAGLLRALAERVAA
jgi:flavorubredoxin